MPRKGFTDPLFHDETAARQWFEATRWPNGPICPKCGSAKHYATKKVGVYRCAAPTCRKDFTVMTGSVMERSHAKLTDWAVAFHMAASSKKGFSAHQLHREFGCQYNTAWFLFHRVREAMRRGGLDLPPLGGEGQVVEADETYFGWQENPQPSPKRKGQPYKSKGRGPAGKRAVIALVERGGNVRSFHPAIADGVTVNKIVRENIARETRLHTDESHYYTNVGRNLRRTRKCHIRAASMYAATCTPTRLKASFRSSSAECAACTSTVRRSTYIVIWRSSISATTRAKSQTGSEPYLRFAAVRVSASLIINLAKPDFRFHAARLSRQRRRR